MRLSYFWILTLLLAGCTPVSQKKAPAGDEAAQRAAADTRKALANGDSGLIYARGQPEEVVGDTKKDVVEPLPLVVGADGGLLYKDVLVAPADFASTFAGHTEAILSVDESLEHGQLVTLLDQLREAGVIKVAITPSSSTTP